MSNVNTLIAQRLKKGEQSSKMAAMAKQSVNGQLTSFSGIFSFSDLSEQEKSLLEELLKKYASDQDDVSEDLNSLIFITSEVKAINNQAAILHGERIKKAHTILTKYRDGAFTAWLLAAYGNRQTPYNLMQYYEFHEALPKNLKPQVELMPRQAVYTLASRDGPFEKKQKIVANYKGESKQALLIIIREAFPLHEKDRRKENYGTAVIQGLLRVSQTLKRKALNLTKKQKLEISNLLEEISQLID